MESRKRGEEVARGKGERGSVEWRSRMARVQRAVRVRRDVDVALANERISALTLWHYFDFKINDHDIATCGPCEYVSGSSPPLCGFINVSCARPGGENHKGVVDFWRRKKVTWEIVKEKYTKPQVFSADE